MSEHLEFICPQCGVQVNVPKSQAGERIPCPRCDEQITVPGIKESIDDLFADIFDDPKPEPPQTTSRSAEPASSKESAASTASEAGGANAGSPADDDITLAMDEPNAENIESAPSSTPQSTSSSGQDMGGDQDVDELLPIDDSAPSYSSPVKEFESSVRHKDPFKDQADPKIKIDGVSGDYGSDMFSILCPVCESRVYAQRSRAGSTIKCDDCFSEVEIPPLDEWKSNDDLSNPKLQTGGEMTFAASDDEIKLSDPVDTPKIDYNVNDEYGLEPISKDLLSPNPPASQQPAPGHPAPGQPYQPNPSAPEGPLSPLEPNAAHPIESELFNRQDSPGTPQSEQAMPAMPIDERSNSGTAPEDSEAGYDLLPLDDDPQPKGDSTPSNPLTSTTASPSSSSGGSSEEMGLEPLPLDSAPAPVNEPSQSPMSPTNVASAYSAGASSADSTPGASQTEPVGAAAKASDSTEPQAGSSDDKEANGGDIQTRKNKEDGDSAPDLGEELKGWTSSIANTFRNMDGLLILAVFSGILAFGLGLVTVGRNWMADDEPVWVLIGYFPYALGAFLWLVSLLMEGIILYNSMLSGIYKKKDAAEWPEFNFSEMFGQFLNVGLANIISCVPGLLAWAALASLGGVFVYLAPFFMITSRFLLGPPMMMSALKNQSFYQFYSPTIFQSPRKAGREWLIFFGLLACVGIFMIVFQSLTLIGVCLASAIFGIIYGAFMMVYGTMIGHQFDIVMRKMGETEMLDEGI